MKQEAKIKDWAIEYHPYYYDYVLTGVIYDHPKYETRSGKTGVTSNLISIDLKTGKAETKNTTYTLVGEPKPRLSFGVENESSN